MMLNTVKSSHSRKILATPLLLLARDHLSLTTQSQLRQTQLPPTSQLPNPRFSIQFGRLIPSSQIKSIKLDHFNTVSLTSPPKLLDQLEISLLPGNIPMVLHNHTKPPQPHGITREPVLSTLLMHPPAQPTMDQTQLQLFSFNSLRCQRRRLPFKLQNPTSGSNSQSALVLLVKSH